MSYLVNDLLIEPVLRRARQFSRSNIQRESIECKQSIPNCNDEAVVEDSAEQSEPPIRSRAAPASETNQRTSLLDSSMKCKPTEVNKRCENIFHSRENIGPSVLLIPSQDAHPTSMGVLYSPGAELNNHTIDDSSSVNSYLFPENHTTSSRADLVISDHETESENEEMDSSQRHAHRSESNEESNVNFSHPTITPLPEDDKMGKLRRQIQSIQEMDIKPEQKARLMHQLLNRKYMRAQQMSKIKKQGILFEPTTIINQERTATPISLTSFLWQLNGGSETPAEHQNHVYRLSPDDLKQTYVPVDNQENDNPADPGFNDETSILGCKHYQRNVKLQCSACDKWYTCRLCHDEVEDHILNRKATKNMLCMICGRAQKAGEYCINCNERTAWYYCDVCKLWDNDTSKNIYHCNDCGICRKGLGVGKDFFHCKTCGTCMSMSVEHSHKCIERVSDCDCPICGEYMFTSPTPVVFMLCGHGIHKACYDEHLKTSYKCPICSKSTVNMETQFRNLDRAIISQPMPPQFRNTKAMVSCNDCCAKSSVKYHWLGLKCAICDSYNTAQLSILSDSTAITNSSDSRNTNLLTNTNNSEVLSETSNEPFLIQQRRHSTYNYPTGSNDRLLHRFFPVQRSERNTRSLSPMSRLGHIDEALSESSETDDSAVEEEGELDFWGLDQPRSVSSGENLDEIEEAHSEDDSGLEECDEADSDEDSALEECDEAEDEEDKFALFGHR